MTLQHGLRVAAMLVHRDWALFLQQRARVFAAIGTPVMLWLLLGSGFVDRFAPADAAGSGYAAFLLPGMMTLVVVFGAIFTSISIIDDRDSGWLRTTLVAPVPAWSIALGKIAGGSSLAIAQAAVLFLALPLVGSDVSIMGVAYAMLGLIGTGIAMTGLGMALAWTSPTTSSYHAVMNLVFLPLWMFSSAFFPAPEGRLLGLLMRLDPLLWCTEAIRQPLNGADSAPTVALGVTWGFALVCGVFAARRLGRPPRH